VAERAAVTATGIIAATATPVQRHALPARLRKPPAGEGSTTT
jgi:hypothetical protein